MVQYAPIPLRDKALAFRKDAVRLSQGQMVAPTMAIVYPTYSCNMRCFGCISNAENAKPASIDIGMFGDFVQDFKDMGGESLEFSGGGEPTLHPKFGQLITEVAAAQLQFGMITNGTKPEAVRDVLAYPRSRYVRVSVYTTNQLDFLREIVRDRNALGSSCRIGGKILLGASDVSLLEYMVEETLRTGVDFVSVKAKRHCADDPELLSVGRKTEIAATIARLVQVHKGKVFGGITKTHQSGPCWTSPFHTVLDALGTIWICCYYQDRVEDISIGNLLHTSFEELWYSPDHKAAMNRVDTHECDFYDCRFHVYNEILSEEIHDDKSHLAFI